MGHRCEWGTLSASQMARENTMCGLQRQLKQGAEYERGTLRPPTGAKKLHVRDARAAGGTRRVRKGDARAAGPKKLHVRVARAVGRRCRLQTCPGRQGCWEEAKSAKGRH